MINRAPHARGRGAGDETDPMSPLPHPTLQYRLEAWRAFQRALDPLAPPKPLRQPRRR
jgi:hypothetical protein